MTTPAPRRGFLRSTTRRRSVPLSVASIGGCLVATGGCAFLAVAELRYDETHWLTFVAFCLLTLWFLVTLIHEIRRASRPPTSSDGATEETVSVPTELVDEACEEAGTPVEAIRILRSHDPTLGLADAKNLVVQRWNE